MAKTAGGKKGFHLTKMPKAYPLTEQQKKFKKVTEECGIHKGMSKGELQTAMKECVGPKMKETSEEQPEKSGAH